jgi:hypothetical protein
VALDDRPHAGLAAMKGDDRVRVNFTERHLRVLVRATREALASDLLRAGELGDAYDVLELLDSKLPAAEERHRVGAVTGRLLLREEILRLLAAAEDAGRGTLTLWDVDERLTDKLVGTSIRCTVEELAREKLIAIRSGDPRLVSLTREGRARARRRRDVDRGEHAVGEPQQLLDLIYRARVGGVTRCGEDGRQVSVDAIWHEPTVQGSAGVDAARFAAHVGALEADRLIGPGSGSYRTITEDGTDLVAKRFAEHRLPTGLYQPPRLLPPTRHPHELHCLREDCECPLCGRPASWLRTRKGKRYEELRAVGMAEHVCTNCAVKWTVYTEPVDDHGRYDPFADPVVCRPRWAYRAGYWYSDQLAPPDHWQPR